MKVTHELCGYDRTTTSIAVEYDIPTALLPVVRTMIQPEPDDRDLILAYKIEPENVRRLASMLGATVDADAFNFSVEASAVPDEVRAADRGKVVAAGS
ncbi:MAG: hypothetical protein EXR07_21720 [Acetobacteraceae bacterium]|nr:hypothetical protein [Acetobacteraceae bacterium]